MHESPLPRIGQQRVKGGADRGVVGSRRGRGKLMKIANLEAGSRSAVDEGDREASEGDGIHPANRNRDLKRVGFAAVQRISEGSCSGGDVHALLEQLYDRLVRIEGVSSDGNSPGSSPGLGHSAVGSVGSRRLDA